MALNPCAVKTLVLSSGERLPVLIALATGVPLFGPSIYVLSEIRATNRASNTIDQLLRSIMVLQLYLDSNQIDIEERIQDGGFYPVSTDGLKRAENFRSCLATLRRIRGL